MAVYLIFGGGFAALQAERTLRRAGLAAAVVPAPPGAAGPCGAALRIAEADEMLARSVLARAGRPVLRTLAGPG